jgi:hypothetical protein
MPEQVSPMLQFIFGTISSLLVTIQFRIWKEK